MQPLTLLFRDGPEEPGKTPKESRTQSGSRVLLHHDPSWKMMGCIPPGFFPVNLSCLEDSRILVCLDTGGILVP